MKARATKEQEFRKVNLFSKDDVLASFRAYMEYLGGGEGGVEGLFDGVSDGVSGGVSDGVYGAISGGVSDGVSGAISDGISKRRIELCRAFLEKIEACRLPALTEPWRFYEYLVAEDRIELNLCTASQVEFDKKGRLSWSTSVEQTLIKLECRLLTVEEFARLRDVTPATVRQWIRRGKLRTARKVGREWFIPELQDRPEMVYKPAYYLVSQQELLKIPGFPLVSVCDTITISQDRTDRKSFVVDLRNSQSGFRQTLVLNNKEVEAFEYALILSGKTTQGSYGHLIFGLEHTVKPEQPNPVQSAVDKPWSVILSEAKDLIESCNQDSSRCLE